MFFFCKTLNNFEKFDMCHVSVFSYSSKAAHIHGSSLFYLLCKNQKCGNVSGKRAGQILSKDTQNSQQHTEADLSAAFHERQIDSRTEGEFDFCNKQFPCKHQGEGPTHKLWDRAEDIQAKGGGVKELPAGLKRKRLNDEKMWGR